MLAPDVFSIEINSAAISFKSSSDVKFVQSIIHSAVRFARQHGAKDTLPMFIVLQELLSNAIVHGNRSIPERTVNCSIERTADGRFKIAVRDEGQGFDFAAMDISLPEDPRNIQNRGYILIHSICNAIEFNEQGNQITVFVDLSGNNKHETAFLRTSDGR